MKDLPPEVVAVAFAKTSRSPEPFDQIAAELTEAGSARFHEKWVVGYGHASVAEHAVLSLAIENVSILAAKAIEDNRLASYTEKSTRYQVYEPERVYRPECLLHHPDLAREYEALIRELLTTYIDWSRQALEWFRRENPRPADKSEAFWESRLRAQACDAIRYLLPTATLTNLGWTVNARELAHAIRKLTGSELAELRMIGEEIKTVATGQVPTLLKYADPDLARGLGAGAVAGVLKSDATVNTPTSVPRSPEVRVLQHDSDGLSHLCCAVAYPHQGDDWNALAGRIRQWSTGEMIALLREYVAPLGPFDSMPRAFEHLVYLIEITIDYGAWRDIQRHRIGTQTAQELTPHLGYTVPTLIDQLGWRGRFGELAGRSQQVYDAIHAVSPAEAVYALMLAFRKRSLFVWNLREVCHFVRLRGTAKGHDAYRAIAHDLWRQMLRLQPWLGEITSPLGSDFRAW
ncbi:MAG: FAD-dependent thymidylate synthase [Candidatus Zixiibacteriota bacterium]